MSIYNSFLAIHERMMNWSLFLYRKTGWGKKVWDSDAVPKMSAESLLLLLLYFLWKNQRNTVSSRLHTSHLKFESDFSKETIFEAEQVHLISNTVIHPHCPSTETICESRVWIQNFLDLFNLGHFPETLNNNTSYDKMFFFWLEHVSSGNWTGYHAN